MVQGYFDFRFKPWGGFRLFFSAPSYPFKAKPLDVCGEATSFLMKKGGGGVLAHLRKPGV